MVSVESVLPRIDWTTMCALGFAAATLFASPPEDSDRELEICPPPDMLPTPEACGANIAGSSEPISNAVVHKTARRNIGLMLYGLCMGATLSEKWQIASAY